MAANWGAIAIEIESEDAGNLDSAYRYAAALASPHVVTGRYTDGPGNVRTGGLTLTGGTAGVGSLEEWGTVATGGERNARMWILAFRQLQGQGGSEAQRYSDVVTDIVTTGTGANTSADPWMQWRGIHYYETTGLAARIAAEGGELGITFWCANQSSASGWETPFARWESDSVWAVTIIPQVRAFARACKAEGATLIGIDGELYSYQTSPYGDTHNSGWTENYHGRTCTITQAHAFARQRGREIADAILAEMPGAVWWSYYTDLPGSNRAIVHGSDNFYANQPSVDFLAGICSNPSWGYVHIVDPSFYKDPQVWGNTPGMQQWCDAIRNGQMGSATTICARLSDSEWDGIAAKLCFPPFLWLTVGTTAFEARMPYSNADVGIRAASYATVGGWWYLYTQQTTGGSPVIEDTSPVGTGYDYDEFEPLLQTYGAVGFGAEVSLPTITITNTEGGSAGNNFSTFNDSVALMGTCKGGPSAMDPGGFHAIHHVTWSNAGTGASGECRLSYVNELIGLGQWDPSDFSKAPQTGARLKWHMDWSKPLGGDRPVMLTAGTNLITVTAYDAHGNTASDTMTVTRSVGTGLVQSMVAEAAAIPVAVTMPQTCTAGNLLVAVLYMATTSSGLNSVTTSVPWQRVNFVQHASETRVIAKYLRISDGTETGFQFSKTSGSNAAALVVMEFTGLTSAATDRTNTAAPAGTASTSVQPGTTGTLGQTNEVIVAAALTHIGNGGGEAIDSGFTLIDEPTEASLTHLVVGYKAVSVNTAENPTLSWTTPAGTAALITTFGDPVGSALLNRRTRAVPFATTGRSYVRTG